MTATVAHTEYDEFDVYIGRQEGGQRTIRNTPPGECWGNPYTLEEYSRGASIRKFATLLQRLLDETPVLRLHVARLHGQRLGCWCRRVDESGPACHGDVLASHAARLRDELDARSPCAPDEHVLVRYQGVRRCARCGFFVQSLTDWYGQNVRGGEQP